jgi:hypothetical protein
VETALKFDSKHASELSFPPPYSEQAKYLELADKFLRLGESSKNGNKPEYEGELVRPIDSSKFFNQATKAKKAA